MSKEVKLRFEHGPEWEQYSKFKGRKVRIDVPPYTEGTFENGGSCSMVGKLVWVDLYTLGIIFSGGSDISIVYKGPGMIVSLA